MRLAGFVCRNTRNPWKTLREIFEKRWEQKPSNNQRMLNTDIQAKWGPIFYVYLVKRAARTPAPVSYATWSKHLHFAQLIFVLVINFVNIC